ncbi:unnamed protein product [Chrysoparadoxa australica]
MDASGMRLGRPLDAVSPETAPLGVSPERSPEESRARAQSCPLKEAELKEKKITNEGPILAIMEATKSLQVPGTVAHVRDILSHWGELSDEARQELKLLMNTFYKPAGERSPFRPLNGFPAKAEPLPRAPENVFVFRNEANQEVFGWRNIFSLPVEYDVEISSGLLNTESSVLAVRHLPADGPRRRFIVIDEAVHEIYGAKLAAYFEHHGIETCYVVLPGEEANKRWDAVDKILDQLCIFALRRREPIVAIGGGVLLDIVGLAANLYRRGVPYIRVPTTLLSIVDASIGVKNGVDYCCSSKGPQKNRVGSFYAPVGAFLDKSFIATQNERNLINGLGEIMKLALVRSYELFTLLESHGARLVKERFQGKDGVADRVIELSIQIMLEELGPNLWEHKLDRCVDYGHTFSKIIEMAPEADIMHGEAVNVDGFLCILLAERRGLISASTRDRVLAAMTKIGLPTSHPSVTPDIMYQGLMDAVEHRHGKQRIPLITSIGASVCVNDITREELVVVCDDLWAIHSE